MEQREKLEITLRVREKQAEQKSAPSPSPVADQKEREVKSASSASSSKQPESLEPNNWLNQLGDLLAEDKASIPAKGYPHHLSRHMNSPVGQGLEDQLKSIFCLLTDRSSGKSLTDNQKIAIKIKLREEVGLCSSGYRNRVGHALVMSETPQSFEELQNSIHQDLVRKAIPHGIPGADDIHTERAYYLEAVKQGFRAKDPNPNDIYGPPVVFPRERIPDDIRETFSKYDTLFTRMSISRDKIKHALSLYGYIGRVKEGSYPDLECEAFVKYLGKIFGEPVNTKEEIKALRNKYILMNKDTDCLEDVNWAVINKQLWERINKEFDIKPESDRELLDKLAQRADHAEGVDSSALESKENERVKHEDDAVNQLISVFSPKSVEDIVGFASFAGLTRGQTDGLLFEFFKANPQNILDNLINFASLADLTNDEARELLLVFLRKFSISKDELLSGKFLRFVYARRSPLLTPEEQQLIIFSRLSPEELKIFLERAVAFNLPHVFSSLAANPEVAFNKGALFELAIARGHVEVAKRLMPRDEKNAISLSPAILWSDNFLRLAFRNTAPLLTPEEQNSIFSYATPPWDELLGTGIAFKLRSLVSRLIKEQPILQENLNNQLRLAVMFSFIEITKSLIACGADVNYQKQESQVKGHISAYTPLFIAVNDKNIELTLILLDANANINVATDEKITPLHLAVKHDIPLIRLLLERGVDTTIGISDNAPDGKGRGLTARDVAWFGKQRAFGANDNALMAHFQEIEDLIESYERTPALWRAAAKGESKRVEQLLKNGANPGLLDDGGRTSLMAAAIGGNPNIVKMLLEDKRTGADTQKTINAQDKLGITALGHAAFYGHHEVVSLLLKSNADAICGKAMNRNAQATYGNAFILAASQKGNVQTIQILMDDKRTRQAVQSSHVFEALVFAIFNGDEEMVALLLKDRRLPAISEFDKSLALIKADERDNIRIVELLLAHGAEPKCAADSTLNIDYRTKNRKTALLKKIESGNVEAVGLLLERGADPNRGRFDGQNPLMQALGLHWNCQIDDVTSDRLITLLLTNKHIKVEVNNRDNQGTSALGLAVKGGMRKIGAMKQLLKAGADINLSDFEGNTPLHRAVAAQHLEVIILLLENGADPDARNRAGKTPLDLAQTAPRWREYEGERERRLKLADAMRSYLAKASPPLCEAAVQDDAERVTQLFLNNANLNAKNSDGQTALEIARKKKHVNFVRAMFEAAVENAKWDVMYQTYDVLAENKVEATVNMSPDQERSKLVAAQWLAGQITDELDEIIIKNTKPLDRFLTAISPFSKIPTLSVSRPNGADSELKRCIAARDSLAQLDTLTVSQLDGLISKQHPVVAKKLSLLKRYCAYSGLTTFQEKIELSPRPNGSVVESVIIETKSSVPVSEEPIPWESTEEEEAPRIDNKHTRKAVVAGEMSEGLNHLHAPFFDGQQRGQNRVEVVQIQSQQIDQSSHELGAEGH